MICRSVHYFVHWIREFNIALLPLLWLPFHQILAITVIPMPLGFHCARKFCGKPNTSIRECRNSITSLKAQLSPQYWYNI